MYTIFREIFFKSQTTIEVDIHDGKCSLYCPHSQGRKPLRLELILTLSLTLSW